MGGDPSYMDWDAKGVALDEMESEPEPAPPARQAVAELVEEEEEEEEEAGAGEEAAAAGAGAAPQARLRPRPARRGRKQLAIFAVGAVAIVVVGLLGCYFVGSNNVAPIASFTFSPTTVPAGAVVTFDATNSTDPDGTGIRDYRWDFGDGSTGSGKVLEHGYAGAGTHTIRLTVVDNKDGRSTVEQSIVVTPLLVTTGPPMVGDDYTYSVDDHVSVTNPDGIYTFVFRIAPGIPDEVVTVTAINAHLTGTKTATVDRTVTAGQADEAQDGFLRSHDARVERAEYDPIKVEGNVVTSLPISTPLAGSLRATVVECICNLWDRPVKSTLDLSGTFTIGSGFTLTERDTGTFYNELTGIEDSFSLRSFLRGTRFDSEDRSDHQLQVGGGTYVWHSNGMEKVAGRAALCMHINVTMSPSTLQSSGLDAFFTDVWLEPGLSQPVKDHVHTVGMSGSNSLLADLTETMTSSLRGTEPVGAACSADHNLTIKQQYQSDFSQLDLVPAMGGTVGGVAFSPEAAVEAARTAIPEFDSWLASHPEAFCTGGNYSVTGGDARWNLAFGMKGSTEHYRITVHGAGMDATGSRYTDARGARGTPADIGEVLTLSRGIRLLRNKPDISTNAFSGNYPDWTRFNLTIGEGGQAISVNPSNLAGSSGTSYLYMLEGKDPALSSSGKYRAALDARNGQILLSWTQKETETGRIR